MFGTPTKKPSTEKSAPKKFTPPATPYGGMIEVGGKLVPADTAPHLLVSGPTGTGKALALSTPIPTPDGFVTMRDITVGQTVLGRDGTPCTVTDVWDVIAHPELYRLVFSTGDELRADADHQWSVVDPDNTDSDLVVTTGSMLTREEEWLIRKGDDFIGVVDIEKIAPNHPDYEPARCIAVDADDAVFLAGEGGVPTHNSRRVLGPGILAWRGPVVAVSSKPDLIGLTMKKRLSQGGYDRTFVLDLSGEVPDNTLPAGVHRVVVDPVTLVGTDDDALDLASILSQSGAAGAGGGKGGSGGDPFWENISLAPLAAILRAAGRDGIAWARQAISQVEVPEGVDKNAEDIPEPCWPAAVRRLNKTSPLLAQELYAAGCLDEKMRDSIAVTMKNAVAPWLRSTVVGTGRELPFHPDMLADKHATLFMVAPATGVAAGAAVSAVDFISKRWRANQTESKKLPRLLVCVDELCNTMPWSKLPTVVTESRAMGINLLVAVQATSQFAKRYGKEGMDELREVFPSTLILLGAAEKEMLEDAAWWSGQVEKSKTSTDHLGKQSQSAEMVDVMTAQDLLPHDIDHARLLRGKKPGAAVARGTNKEAGLEVQLIDISELIPDFADYELKF